jgi:hypothetical protein
MTKKKKIASKKRVRRETAQKMVDQSQARADRRARVKAKKKKKTPLY